MVGAGHPQRYPLRYLSNTPDGPTYALSTGPGYWIGSTHVKRPVQRASIYCGSIVGNHRSERQAPARIPKDRNSNVITNR